MQTVDIAGATKELIQPSQLMLELGDIVGIPEALRPLETSEELSGSTWAQELAGSVGANWLEKLLEQTTPGFIQSI